MLTNTYPGYNLRTTFTIAISLLIWFMDSVVRFVVVQIMGAFGA